MLIDSHCHLPHSHYKKDLDLIINDAKKAGVTKLINIGTSLKDSQLALKVASQYDNIFATTAIYPHEDMGKTVEELRSGLEEILDSGQGVYGIGECGIDISNWEGGRDVAEQEKVFEMQIELAVEHDLPLIIHNRNGDDLVFKLLEKHKSKKLRGVAHCFASTLEASQRYLDLGFYISFSGMITYPSRKDLVEVAKSIPMDRLLVETDAPYLPPQGHRGEPNYPEYVKIVAEKVAQVKEKPFDEIADWTYKNTCTLFKLK